MLATAEMQGSFITQLKGLSIEFQVCPANPRSSRPRMAGLMPAQADSTSIN